MLSIVQVNTHARVGGAACLARDLHAGLLRAGDRSVLVVGHADSAGDSVRVLDSRPYRDPWARFWLGAESWLDNRPRFKGKSRLAALFGATALPARTRAARRGLEYFDYPATWHPEEWAQPAELLHLHNLHGGYFDLRALPMLSARYPTVLTLHDAWLLGGHCAHSLDCERWRVGCGNCPGLWISPSVRRDSTAENWREKRRILEQCSLYVATPSRWLMNKVENSLLASAVAEARVIANGVDLSVFKPRDRQEARADLGLPAEAHVAIFAAHGGRTNPWKDFATVDTAAAVASRALDRPLVLLAIGKGGPAEDRGNLRVEHVPHLEDRELLLNYLGAADICLHAAHAENFPLWLSESLACGVPVVSTRVGGIPEVVTDGLTGLLVDPGDTDGFTRAALRLLQDDELRRSMSRAAVEDAGRRLALDRMVDDYRRWYGDLIGRMKPGSTQPGSRKGGGNTWET